MIGKIPLSFHCCDDYDVASDDDMEIPSRHHSYHQPQQCCQILARLLLDETSKLVFHALNTRSGRHTSFPCCCIAGPADVDDEIGVVAADGDDEQHGGWEGGGGGGGRLDDFDKDALVEFCSCHIHNMHCFGYCLGYHIRNRQWLPVQPQHHRWDCNHCMRSALVTYLDDTYNGRRYRTYLTTLYPFHFDTLRQWMRWSLMEYLVADIAMRSNDLCTHCCCCMRHHLRHHCCCYPMYPGCDGVDIRQENCCSTPCYGSQVHAFIARINTCSPIQIAFACVRYVF